MKTLAAIILLMISIVMAGNVKQERVVDIEGDAGKVEGKIAIIRNVSSPFDRELGIMNANATNYRPIPNVPRADIHGPRWSSDGKKIVFYYRGDYDEKMKGREGGIYVINSDGTNLKKVYSKLSIEHPSFSPDGEQIVFLENDEICTINIDGTNFKQLTHNMELKEGEKIIRIGKYYPSYSPDGSKIVFCGVKSIYGLNDKFITGGTANVFVINSDGSELKEVASTDLRDGYFCPYWSPNGKKISYTNVIINADGTNIQKLPIKGGGIQWSSDGQKIMYEVAVSTDWPFYLWEDRIELYIANADGTNEKLIKRWKGEYSNIAFDFDWWTPKPEKEIKEENE